MVFRGRSAGGKPTLSRPGRPVPAAPSPRRPVAVDVRKLQVRLPIGRTDVVTHDEERDAREVLCGESPVRDTKPGEACPASL